MSLDPAKNPRTTSSSLPWSPRRPTASIDRGQYTFRWSPPDPTRLEIKQAIETIFDVKVASVNTINRQGQAHAHPFRDRASSQGHQACDRHPASEGTIDIFGGPQA